MLKSVRPAPSTLLLTLALSLLFVVPTVHADWPQWRGPNLDGTASAEGLPVEWGPESHVAWSLPLPARSGATPVITGDRIFLNVSYDPESDDRLELWCVDRTSGEVLWKRSLGGGNELKYKQHMSSPSPVTDGERVWVMSGTGIVKAFSLEGEELWTRDLQKDYGPFGLNWGYAASPLLHDGDLFIPVLHGMKTDDPSYVLRVDADTGKTLWRVERPTDAVFESPDSYTTPMPWTVGGTTWIVVVGGDVVTGHDPASGAERWRLGGLNPEDSRTNRLVASPVVAGEFLFAFGKRGPVLAFRAPRGDETKPTLGWSKEKGTDVPTPVTDGKYLYVVDDQGIAWCLEVATGKVLYGPERLATGTYSASPVLADGKIYAVNEGGVTTVFKAGPELEILATNELDGYTLSTPAVSDGRIYLRTAKALYALGGGGTGAKASEEKPAKAGR